MTRSARRQPRQAPSLVEEHEGTGGILRVVAWCNLVSGALCLLLLLIGWAFGHPLRFGSTVFGVLSLVCLAIGVLALYESRAGCDTR